MDEQRQRELASRAASEAGLHAEELWIRYFALGGSLAQIEIDAYLQRLQMIPSLEREILAHTLSEAFEETGRELPGLPAGSGGAEPRTGTVRAARADTGDPLESLGAAGAVFLTAEQAETQRMRALMETGLLDSPPEERFDRITRRAREHFGVSSSIVALIAEHRQFLKSVIGALGQNLERESTFCNQTIRSAGPMVVCDTLTDDRFRSSPLVVGEPHIRFYAGHPLLGPGGWTIGTLCVIDQNPRGFTGEDRRVLRSLAEAAQQEVMP
ncbi:GAF domain-containing protein [Arthrobacter sp. MSA 4-2]|uniref:GAF domain-containing protein n=1 Tax=Arthrobacter sp. MSA 4-2 TaxID=2794349 RepID=UPI0018E849CB|nr:GAF domain-containing protein [Arthrobacter sp. MSA 4-2]MBJ2121593.1 GAF domain-containing protein [Arthrobacter sp. MSA 4-2]